MSKKQDCDGAIALSCDFVQSSDIFLELMLPKWVDKGLYRENYLEGT
ncbi:hypothetical protein [Providencia sp. Me31A]